MCLPRVREGNRKGGEEKKKTEFKKLKKNKDNNTIVH